MSEELKKTDLAIASQNNQIMLPAVSVAEVIKAKEKCDELIRACLKHGKDYGIIPGTEKPSLFKPGSEQILAWYNCYTTFVINSEDHDLDRVNTYQFKNKQGKFEQGKSTGLHAYRVLCYIHSRINGLVVGSGVGSCTTAEKKYISRPNDSDNTVLKMAKKRAQIDAVLSTFGLSERFTQDMEDFQDSENTPIKKQEDLPPKKDEKSAPFWRSEYNGKSYINVRIGKTFSAEQLEFLGMKPSKKPGLYYSVFSENIWTALEGLAPKKTLVEAKKDDLSSKEDVEF